MAKKIINEPIPETVNCIQEVNLFPEEALPQKSNVPTKIDKINPQNFADISKEMVYSISNLSSVALKLYYTAVSKIEKDEDVFRPYTFAVKDIVKEFNINTNAIYEIIAKATDELENCKLLFWDSEHDCMESVNLFYSAKYYFGEGKISLDFSMQVKEHLLKLQRDYYKVPLKYLLMLSSPKAMRIFNILYGQYYLDNYKRKIKKDCVIEISVRKLIAMFEYDYYARKKVTGKFDESLRKYPTLKQFSRSVLDPSIKAIKASGLLNIEKLKPIRGRKDENCDIDYDVNPHQITHLVYSIGAGENLAQLEMERTQELKRKKAKNEDDALLREICEYFKVRFDIHESVIMRLSKKYSNTSLMLAAISMQSILNLSSRGLWIYNEFNKYKWDDPDYREKVCIREYQQIAIPNLGLFFDGDNPPREFIIKKPVGFLKATLEKQMYFDTIDFINSQVPLATFDNDAKEKLYTNSFYDNEEWGEAFKKYIKNRVGIDFDILCQVFHHCHYGATTMHTNEKWVNYFYKDSKLNLYWKADFYKQDPDRQKAMIAKVDRILKLRKLA